MLFNIFIIFLNKIANCIILESSSILKDNFFKY